MLSAACVIVVFATLGSPPTIAETAAGDRGMEIPSLAPMVERAMTGVVSISVLDQQTVDDDDSPSSDPLLRRFLGIPSDPQSSGQELHVVGSGVIIDAAKGLILTNSHVLEQADSITVTLGDGRRYEGKRIGDDPATDIAILQIHADHLRGLPFGDSDRLHVGDYIVAIGNPFGLQQSVTLGIVSALGRSGFGLDGYEDFIQTDASINPGNSGGALVDLRGEVVGISTAMVGSSGGNAGIAFAIPINMARKIADQLIAHGKIMHGQLGLVLNDLVPGSPEARTAGVDQGALIAEVVPDSPAEQVGLRAGDVVTEIDDASIRSAVSLRSFIGMLPAGSSVTVTAMRNGSKLRLTAILAEIKPERAEVPADIPALAGLTLESAGTVGSQNAGVSIISMKKDSAAYRAGLRPGDLIFSVDGGEVNSPRDVIRIARVGNGTLTLGIERGDTLFQVEIE
jgi:serine protease Do/serine protease DegQ